MPNDSLQESAIQMARWTIPMLVFAALITGCHPAPEEVWEIRQPAGRGLAYSSIAPAPNGDVYSYASFASLARMSPNGDILWRSISGHGNITSDASGAVYSVTPYPDGSIQIEKHNPEGSAIWSHFFLLDDALESGARLGWPELDANEQGSLAFCGALYTDTLGWKQDLLAVVNAKGDVAWTGNLQYQSSNSSIDGLKLDESGNIYLLARASRPGTVAMEFSEFVELNKVTSLSLPAGPFVMKVDPDGALLWATSLDGHATLPNAIGIDADGHINVATRGAIGGLLGPVLLHRLDSSGTLISSHTFRPLQFIPQIRDTEFDHEGNLVFAGITPKFGVAGLLPPEPYEESRATTMKVDQRGALVWEYQIDTRGVDITDALCTDASGDVYLLSRVESTVTTLDGLEEDLELAERLGLQPSYSIIKLRDPWWQRLFSSW